MGQVEREVTNRCKYHETNEHPDATRNKRFSPAVMFDQVKTNKGNAKVDNTEYHLGDEWADLNRLKYSCPVVEEIVGAG